jgi:hypothetical protein
LGGDSDVSVAVPLDMVRLLCDVTRQATGRPTANPNVSYQAGATEFATTTNGVGSCKLELPAGDLACIAIPAASVQEPRYEPPTLLCAKLQEGDKADVTVFGMK